MIQYRPILSALCALFINHAACHASAPPETLSACGTGTVRAAKDGNTLIFEDGQRIELAAVIAPELWPSDTPHKSWPYAVQSQTALDRITRGQKVALLCEGETKTYQGAFLAHVVLPDGRWLQHILVASGTVYVFPRASHISGIDTLYQAEDHAREQSLGLWSMNPQTLRTPEGPPQTGWFQIVTGKILSTGKGADRTYLNFGTNWRRDFTIEIPRAAEKLFARSGLDPTLWQNKTIEARGWIDWKGGPRLVIDGPGQIRFLD